MRSGAGIERISDLTGEAKPCSRGGSTSTIGGTVDDWRAVGKALRIKASILDDYASAFENPLMAEARKEGGR